MLVKQTAEPFMIVYISSSHRLVKRDASHPVYPVPFVCDVGGQLYIPSAVPFSKNSSPSSSKDFLAPGMCRPTYFC